MTAQATHELPPMRSDQQQHELTEDCWCMPSITIRHREREQVDVSSLADLARGERKFVPGALK